MMTFVAVRRRSERSMVRVEGARRRLGRRVRLLRKLGCEQLRDRPKSKSCITRLAQCCRLLANRIGSCRTVWVRAGIQRKGCARIMQPIVIARSACVAQRGEPIVQWAAGARRFGTVAAHLEALGAAPESRVYRALMEYG